MAALTDVSEEAVELVSGFTAWQSGVASCVRLVEKWRELFNAYDMRESGRVPFGDYMKLEIRNGLEQGDLKRVLRAFPTISRADPKLSGLDFLAFCKTRMSPFDVKGLCSSRQLMQDAENDLESTLVERFRMGPEYSWEIRKELKEVFTSWRSTSEGLSPSDWLMANRIVEIECDSDLAEKWTGESGFQAADTNGDGMIQLEEFLPFSTKVLQNIFSGKSQDALHTLKKVMSHPVKTLPFGVKIKLFLPHPPFTFQLPNLARHVDCSFWHADTLEVPSSMSEVEDLCSLLRIKLKLVGTTFSAFWIQKSVELLCGDNCKAILRSAFEGAKQSESVEGSIFLKNIRSRVSRLKEIQLQQLPVNAQCSYTGMRWCLNWEAHLIGLSGRKPARLPYDFVVGVGDVLAIQLPAEESGILWKVFVEDILHNKPCLEQQEVVKGKKGKKARLQSVFLLNSTSSHI